MSQRTIGQIKTIMASRLHGTTINKLSDFYTLCRDAWENMVLNIDLQETVRKGLLANAVYDRVYDYSIPDDFKAPKDLVPQTSDFQRRNNSSLSRTFSKEFSNRPRDNQFTIVFENGIQYMRFGKCLTIPALIDKCESLTDNGAWAVGGNASGLVVDTLNYIAGLGSLKASVSSPGAVQSVQLRIGADNANYYQKVITAGHFASFMTGWNLCRFDLDDAVETGAVDKANIKYVKVLVTYNSGQTAFFEKTLTQAVDLSVNSGDYFSDGAIFLFLNFNTVGSLVTLRLDNITANIGTLYELSYYSKYLFKNAAGDWIEIPTADTDTVNLSTISNKIFEAELSKLITQEIQGAMGEFDYEFWDRQLGNGDVDDEEDNGLYSKYKMQFPSERIESQTSYFNFSDDMEGLDGWDEGDYNSRNRGQ